MKFLDFENGPNWQIAREMLPESLRHPSVGALIALSLVEDLSAKTDSGTWMDGLLPGDVTSSATLDDASLLKGRITAKDRGVVAGLPVAAAVFKWVDSNLSVQSLAAEGEEVRPGKRIAEISGAGRALLAAERTALNFLGRLSGIATLTRQYVRAVAGTRAVILDTRKTLPGFRRLDKYAVRMGGGQNHRMGLYDMILIKDNHIDGAGGLAAAVQKARQQFGRRFPVEVEVKDLDELAIALTLPIDRIMLDNMDLEAMRRAVRLTAGSIPLEASGNVTLETVRAIAETGVDFISVGALTHSVSALDLSMRLS